MTLANQRLILTALVGQLSIDDEKTIPPILAGSKINKKSARRALSGRSFA